MEKVLGFHHEPWTVKVVLSEDNEIGKLLATYSSELPGNVAAIIEGKFPTCRTGPVSLSQLDVDRMDYCCATQLNDRSEIRHLRS